MKTDMKIANETLTLKLKATDKQLRRAENKKKKSDGGSYSN